MKASVKTITIGLITALGIGLAGSASAATPWQREQARRAEIARVHHEDARIDHLLRSGRITPFQARQMHRDVHGRSFAYGYHR